MSSWVFLCSEVIFPSFSIWSDTFDSLTVPPTTNVFFYAGILFVVDLLEAWVVVHNASERFTNWQLLMSFMEFKWTDMHLVKVVIRCLCDYNTYRILIAMITPELREDKSYC